MNKLPLLGTAALLVGMLVGFGGTGPSIAAPLPPPTTTTLYENPDNNVLTYHGATIAGDGEATFDPFQFGADTSDGIVLPGLGATAPSPWTIDGSSVGWTQVGGTTSNTWVLPANLNGIGCGAENGTTCEPVGIWHNATPFTADQLGILLLLESADDPTVSDIITFSNDPNGAVITFASDPVATPVPAALPLFASGLGVMGFFAKRRKRKNAVRDQNGHFDFGKTAARRSFCFGLCAYKNSAW